MPQPRIFIKSLRDLRWQVFWYGVGLASMAAFVVYLYPSYAKQLQDFKVPEALKPFVGNAEIASPNGFLSAEIFSWAPIILVIFAIMAGTSALAGEEAGGTLDLLLAQPISRARLAAEKIAAFACSAALIAAIILLGWLVSIPFVDFQVSWGRLVLATFNVIPITLFFGALSMCAGAASSERRSATGVVTAVAVLTYFVHYLAALVDAIRPLQWASPFYYYGGGKVLAEGMNWPHMSVLVAGSIVLLGLTLVFFQQRDIGARSASIRGPRLRLRREARSI
jgi:ABC-2 type transport system permease protein